MKCLRLACLLVLLAAAPARADGGDARATGRCGGGATAELRVRADHGALAVEFEVKRRRGGEAWRVALVHERRVEWRGNVRTSGSGFRIRRSLRDLDGPDQVTARASGPGGITCDASATLSG
jgi:hypothetical protein